MSDHYGLTPGQLDAHSATVGQISHQIREAAAAAHIVNTNGHAWGFLCQFFGLMASAANHDTTQMIGKVSEVGQEIAERLRQCERNYADVETEITTIMNGTHK